MITFLYLNEIILIATVILLSYHCDIKYSDIHSVKGKSKNEVLQRMRDK